MSELRVSGLSKAFGARPVLAGVDLTVASGALTAVLGPSGSGKTTLLRLVAGFERPDAGTISVGGRPVAGAGAWTPPERRRIGYVAQEGSLFPHLTVEANVSFGLPRRARRDRRPVARLLEMVGLGPHYGPRTPGQLSGGEQQRVALARALAPRPQLVLLDEPFASLDAGLRQETRQAVAAALAEAGATAVLVTHDQAEALSLGRQVAVLLGGRLAQVADPVTLYELPASPEVARFVGEAVLLPGRSDGCWVDTVLGRLAAAGSARGPVTVLVRPEQIAWSTDPAAPGIAARVRGVTYYGHDATLDVALGDDSPLAVRTAGRPVGGLPARLPAVGEEVRLVVRGGVVAY
ncbi:MAG: ABC transporter ATP-binding protein [Acidimicrobiales bacterium]